MLKYFQVQGETLHTAGPDIFKDTDDTGSTASWRFYSHPSVWRPTLVCFAIMFFFQATGFNTIIANTALIFKESKIPIDEHVASGVTGGVILISCAVALVLSRLLPRKMLLLTSSTGTRYIVDEEMDISGLYDIVKITIETHFYGVIEGIILILVSMTTSMTTRKLHE